MATESVTTQASEPCLWGYINQLETLLEVMNEDLCDLCFLPEEERRARSNRVHNILGAAIAVAGQLAVEARVR